jgi:hypothetical protein
LSFNNSSDKIAVSNACNAQGTTENMEINGGTRFVDIGNVQSLDINLNTSSDILDAFQQIKITQKN